MSRLQKVIIAFIGILLVLSILGIVLYMSQVELTSRENVIFNVLLTLFSAAISVIISHYYFDASQRTSIENIKRDYQSNLSIYARKAAEKVDNLSNELNKLSLYLQQDDEQNLSPEDALIVKEERIRSVIHIIETLKSVNDRSLSDWRGVIPEEEIEEQRETRQEREIELKELLEDYRELLSPMSRHYVDSEANENLRQEIAALNRKIERLAPNIIGTPIKKGAALQLAKEKVAQSCPNCGAELTYRQRPMTTSVKGFKCKECDARLISRWTEANGYEVSVKQGRQSLVMPEHQERQPLDENLLDKVRKELPIQPWPTGTNKRVAEKLGITPRQASKAANELIKRGEYKVQINGTLYEPLEQNTQ